MTEDIKRLFFKDATCIRPYHIMWTGTSLNVY